MDSRPPAATLRALHPTALPSKPKWGQTLRSAGAVGADRPCMLPGQWVGTDLAWPAGQWAGTDLACCRGSWVGDGLREEPGGIGPKAAIVVVRCGRTDGNHTVRQDHSRAEARNHGQTNDKKWLEPGRSHRSCAPGSATPSFVKDPGMFRPSSENWGGIWEIDVLDSDSLR